MPAPIKCQRFFVDGGPCQELSKVFVIRHGESPMAVWKSGLALCTSCGTAVQEITPDSIVVTIDELGDMMEEETVAQQAASQPMATLHDLAAKFNQASVDSTPVAEQVQPSVEEQPAPVEAPKAEEQPTVPSNKAAMLAVLRAEIQKARTEIAQTQTLLASMVNMPEFAKQGLLNAIKTKEKEIAAHERQAAKLLEPPVKYYASKEMVALRHAVFNGGIEALRALDAALASGLLGKKSAPKKADVATSDTQGKVVEQAQEKVTARKNNEERNAEIERLYREGKTEKEIREQLGIAEANKGIVTGVVGRAVEAGRLERHKRAA